MFPPQNVKDFVSEFSTLEFLLFYYYCYACLINAPRISTAIEKQNQGFTRSSSHINQPTWYSWLTRPSFLFIFRQRMQLLVLLTSMSMSIAFKVNRGTAHWGWDLTWSDERLEQTKFRSEKFNATRNLTVYAFSWTFDASDILTSPWIQIVK